MNKDTEDLLAQIEKEVIRHGRFAGDAANALASLDYTGLRQLHNYYMVGPRVMEMSDELKAASDKILFICELAEQYQKKYPPPVPISE